MLLKGIRLVLRFPYGVYSMRLFFPEPLRIPVNCTFTITAPSFRCRLTFLPMQDLALLPLKFSVWSHHSYSWSAILFQHCWHMGSFSPFISMYSLMFSFLQSSFHGFLQCSMFPASGMPLLVFSAFKAVAETTGWSRGGVSESETVNFFVMKEGVVFRLLSWVFCVRARVRYGR